MPNTPKLPGDVEKRFERFELEFIEKREETRNKFGGVNIYRKLKIEKDISDVFNWYEKEIAILKAQVRKEVIGEDEIVFDHRVGSHSDDWGGDSDLPCDCHMDASIRNKLRQQQRQALKDCLSIPSLNEASNE